MNTADPGISPIDDTGPAQGAYRELSDSASRRYQRGLCVLAILRERQERVHPDDVRGGIIRLKAQCLAMQNTYGASQKLMMDLCQDTAEKVIEEAEKLLALRR